MLSSRFKINAEPEPQNSAEACELDQAHNGCRIEDGGCSCAYGCKSDYRYPTRKECLDALKVNERRVGVADHFHDRFVCFSTGPIERRVRARALPEPRGLHSDFAGPRLPLPMRGNRILGQPLPETVSVAERSHLDVHVPLRMHRNLRTGQWQSNSRDNERNSKYVIKLT